MGRDVSYGEACAAGARMWRSFASYRSMNLYGITDLL